MNEKYNFYNKFTGPKNGFCRICGLKKRLTYDHVPPRSCYNFLQTNIIDFPNFEQKIKSKFTGIKIRSICDDCNNKKLSVYDTELGTLIQDISKNYFIYKSNRLKFKSLEFEINPYKIVKGIIGHLLSIFSPLKDLSKDFTKAESDYHANLRKYFLFDKYSFPDNIVIYYWFHPYFKTILLPIFGFNPKLGSGRNISGSLIKFYPLSFWIVINNETNKMNLNLNKLPTNCKENDVFKLKINFNQKISEDFPLTPTSEGFVLYDSKTLIYGIPNIYYENTKILRPDFYF